MAPPGIEPAASRFVAQHLNHCATAIPLQLRVKVHVPEEFRTLGQYTLWRKWHTVRVRSATRNLDWLFWLIRQIFSLKDIPLCDLHNPGVHTNRINIGCSIIFYRKSLGTLAEGPPGHATWQPTPCCHSVLSRQIFKLAHFGAECAPCFSVPRTQHPSTVHSTYM